MNTKTYIPFSFALWKAGVSAIDACGNKVVYQRSTEPCSLRHIGAVNVVGWPESYYTSKGSPCMYKTTPSTSALVYMNIETHASACASLKVGIR